MSEASDLPDGSRLTAALAGLSAAVAELASVASQTCWQETDQALLSGLVELGRLTHAQDAALHRLVREVDRRGTATGTGAPSTAAWLRERLHLHPGAAKRLVTTARGLHDDPSGALVHHTGPDDGNDVGAVAGRPVLAAVFEAGTISGEHAAVAVRVLAELPAEVEPDVVAEAEQYLATEAARRDPAQLARLGRHLTHVLDPDAGDTLDDEPKPADRQHLGIRPRSDGSADIRGRLSPETTAALLAQLQPLAGPRPTVDGHRDLRTPASAPPTRWPSCSAAPPPKGAAPPATARGPPSASRCAWRLCRNGSAPPPPPWAGPGRCPPRPPAGWPATPGSSPSCSAARGNRWTSAARRTRSPKASGGPWSPGTAAAPSTPAHGPLSGPRLIT